jgi:hypothetical protein
MPTTHEFRLEEELEEGARSASELQEHTQERIEELEKKLQQVGQGLF